MPTQLTKPVSRLTACGIIAQIREDGIAIRLPHKKTWLVATWKQICAAGLMNSNAVLKADEWIDPLNMILGTGKVASALRRGRKPKPKEGA